LISIAEDGIFLKEGCETVQPPVTDRSRGPFRRTRRHHPPPPPVGLAAPGGQAILPLLPICRAPKAPGRTARRVPAGGAAAPRKFKTWPLSLPNSMPVPIASPTAGALVTEHAGRQGRLLPNPVRTGRGQRARISTPHRASARRAEGADTLHVALSLAGSPCRQSRTEPIYGPPCGRGAKPFLVRPSDFRPSPRPERLARRTGEAGSAFIESAAPSPMRLASRRRPWLLERPCPELAKPRGMPRPSGRGECQRAATLPKRSIWTAGTAAPEPPPAPPNPSGPEKPGASMAL
jgi:hypothetical protein